MKKYDSYKPSGIDWIGEIPSHWNVCKLGLIFNAKAGGDAKPEIYNETKTSVYRFPVYTNTLNENQVYAYTSEAPFKGNSITVTGRGEIGHAFYRTQDFDAIIRLLVLTPYSDLCCKYYTYLIDGVMEFFCDNAAVSQLSAMQISKEYVIVPPPSEQEAIAAWLDKKCGEIDAAIAKVDREIELIEELKQSEISRVVTRGLNPDVPFRPSGIDWIGEIPEHWKIAPFKRSLKINNGCDYKHVLAEKGYPVIGSGGPFAQASEYLYDGEVLLLGRKGTIDRPMYFEGKFWTVDTMFYAVPNKDVCCKYMYYQALGFPFDYYSTATALPSMAASDLANNPIIVPPLTEQQAIADYLDKKCAEIDGLKAKLTKKRETLKELRQSIISEVVTGKRKVI